MNVQTDFRQGDMVRCHKQNGLDCQYFDQIAVFDRYSTNGYARVHFYGDASGEWLLIHPESLELHHRCKTSDCEEILDETQP